MTVEIRQEPLATLASYARVATAFAVREPHGASVDMGAASGVPCSRPPKHGRGPPARGG
jgi:hypothetical protein